MNRQFFSSAERRGSGNISGTAVSSMKIDFGVDGVSALNIA